MLGLRWFNKHARWEREFDAYVDAELSERERALFDAHLQSCDACAGQVRDAFALKRMLSEGLTEHPVPRSFRLTPAMLVEAAPSEGATPTPWWPRAAQAVGGLAVATFAFLLVVDLSGSSNDSINLQAAAGVDDSTSLESAAPADPKADLLGGEDSGQAADEPPSSAGAAAGNGQTEILTAEDGAADTSADEGAVTSQDGERSERSAGEPGSGSPVGGLEIADQSDDSGIDGLLLAQIASVAVAIVAAVTYFASKRMKQE